MKNIVVRRLIAPLRWVILAVVLVMGGGWNDEPATNLELTSSVEEQGKLLLQGLWVTILISVLAAICGTVLGFGICLMRRSAARWLNIPARIFIWIIQGTPLLVLLMILYYLVFGGVNIYALLVAVLGFSFHFAANTAEMLRTAIDTVDRGQSEGAAALGLSRGQIFRKILFPQAVRQMFPSYQQEFISMVKMTSIVGYIAILDLTKMGDLIRGQTDKAFFPLLATAAIYFVLAYALTALLSIVQLQMNPEHRKRAVRGVVEK